MPTGSPGDADRVLDARRRLAVEGKVLEAEPPRRLVTTWSFRRDPETARRIRRRG